MLVPTSVLLGCLPSHALWSWWYRLKPGPWMRKLYLTMDTITHFCIPLQNSISSVTEYAQLSVENCQQWWRPE